MTKPTLHEETKIIDGLVIAKWGRPVFEAMHKGGLTAVNCTCAVWEGTAEIITNIAQWKQ